MAFYVKQGDEYSVYTDDQVEIIRTLPPRIFNVEQKPFNGPLFLKLGGNFVLPSRFYGNVTKRAERVLNTFNAREGSTGILAAGDKGNGKTLLAKQISILAAKQDMPTIIINKPWEPNVFADLLQNIEQPVVLLFDEFEKNFQTQHFDDDEKSADQEKLLTILDGVNSSKKLFIFTVNEVYRLNRFLLNRPGRIFYRFNYSKISADVVREFLLDTLYEEHHDKIDELVKLSVLLPEFNFDIMQAISEEINRYGDTPTKLMNILNIDGTQNEKKHEIVVYNSNNEEVERESNRVNPYAFRFSLIATAEKLKSASNLLSNNEPRRIDFISSDIVEVLPSGAFIAKREGLKLVATPTPELSWFSRF